MYDRDRAYRLIGGQNNSVPVHDLPSGRLDLSLSFMKILCKFLIIFRVKDHKIDQTSDQPCDDNYSAEKNNKHFLLIISLIDIRIALQKIFL